VSTRTRKNRPATGAHHTGTMSVLYVALLLTLIASLMGLEILASRVPYGPTPVVVRPAVAHPAIPGAS
jgi:hypothetical protein